MNRADLSSNWRALQQKLQEEKQAQQENEHTNNNSSSNKENKHPRPRPHSHPSTHRSLKRKTPPIAISSHPPSTTLPPIRRKLFSGRFSKMNKTQSNGTDPTTLLSSPSSFDNSDFLSSPSHLLDAPLLNYGLSPPPLISTHLGKFLSLDCEMIGTVHAPPRDISTLARVSLVSYNGCQIYDSFVHPPEGTEVTDWRTPYSGITAELLQSAPHGGSRTFETVQAEVRELLENRVIVGHAVHNDLQALGLEKEAESKGWEIRDTSRYSKFRAMTVEQNGNGNGKIGKRRGKIRTPGLRMLARRVLGWEIQSGEHSSVEDARAAMRLFRRERAGMEKEFGKRGGMMRMKGGKGRAGGKDIESGVAGLGVEQAEELIDIEEEPGGNEDDESDGGVGVTAKQKEGTRKKKKKKKKKGKYR